MKKLINPMFLALFLTIAACHSINTGVKVIGNCCKELSVAKRDKTCQEENKESEYSKASSLLPVNAWDGKMMIW
jgi:hypothetical protein